MNKIKVIANKEFNAYLDSISGYIVLVLFLGISGFFTWLSASNIFYINQADLSVFFSVAFWTLFFFVPAITMRTFAEEQHSGTIELLLTHPVSFWQVVIGKALGAFYLILLAIALTLPYYITIALTGKIDHGATISGYSGLLILSATYISIGIFASTLSKNQIVAFLIAIGIGIFFQLIFGLIANVTNGWLASFFDFLNFRSHYETIIRGVWDTKDLIYFGSIIYFFLYASVTVLFIRKYR